MAPDQTEGLCDLHCHLLPGVDDGARSMVESLEMARILVGFGFSVVAPSPHALREFPPREVAVARLAELQAVLSENSIGLRLELNAENALVEDQFMNTLGTADARLLGAGPYILVEAPYTSPVPALLELIFRIKLKGVTPLFAHPERCAEFARKNRAAEVVRAGALLQLDVGALIGRYGRPSQRLASALLDQGLYAVAATDLHSPRGAQKWLERALGELERIAGGQAFRQLFSTRALQLLAGKPLV